MLALFVLICKNPPFLKISVTPHVSGNFYPPNNILPRKGVSVASQIINSYLRGICFTNEVKF